MSHDRIQPQQLDAYIRSFGPRQAMALAAQFAAIPTSVLERATKGVQLDKSQQHGYDAMARLARAMKRRRKEIDRVLTQDKGARMEPKLILQSNGEVKEFPLSPASADLMIGRPALVPAYDRKPCATCGAVKMLSEYWQNKAYADGHETSCIQCRKTARLQRLQTDLGKPAAEEAPEVETPYERLLRQLREGEILMRLIRDGVTALGKETAVELPSLREANAMLIEQNTALREESARQKEEITAWVALVEAEGADELRAENTRLLSELVKAKETNNLLLQELKRWRGH